MASRVINFASGSYAAADRPPAKLAHNLIFSLLIVSETTLRSGDINWHLSVVGTGVVP